MQRLVQDYNRGSLLKLNNNQLIRLLHRAIEVIYNNNKLIKMLVLALGLNSNNKIRQGFATLLKQLVAIK